MNRIVWLIVIATLAGCGRDARLVRVAEDAAARQAQQNDEMARVTGEVAAASRSLVEADAQARLEMAAIQGRLADQQREIGLQRDQLEQERQQIARQRHRDSVLATAITGGALTLATLSPLLLAALVLWWLRDASQELHTLDRLLVEECIAEQPRLPLRSFPDRQPRLPAGSEPTHHLP